MPMNENLLERTLGLIKSRPDDLSLPELAKGAGVKYDWLTALLYGRIKHPSVVRIQRVHDFLAKNARRAA